jgi:hypothetical protein
MENSNFPFKAYPVENVLNNDRRNLKKKSFTYLNEFIERLLIRITLIVAMTQIPKASLV